MIKNLDCFKVFLSFSKLLKSLFSQYLILENLYFTWVHGLRSVKASWRQIVYVLPTPHDKEQFLFPSKCLINISCWIVSDCKLLETKAWISLIFIFPRAPLIELHANPKQSDECPIHGDLLEWDLRHLLYLLRQFWGPGP